MIRSLIALVGLTFGTSSTFAQSPADWFPFAISPLQEGSPGEIDLTQLNEIPAGKSGFIRVQGPHFQDGKGQRVRFFGTNVVASSCFPSKSDAPKIAAHLAKLGHNIIRFHFLDNQWGGDSLLQKPDYKTWNLDAFDRFHFFMHELNKVGIYNNINIHVGRTYEGSPKAGPDMSKFVDLFHEPYILAFQEYSRKLLSTKNPYNGLAPAEDPGVAVIEMNNENTMLMNPWWIHDAPESFQAELRTLWNRWLLKEYRSTESVVKRYGVSDGKLGPNLLETQPAPEAEGNPWWRDDRNPAHSKLSPLAGPERGARWEVIVPGDKAWSHQYNLSKLPLTDGSGYVVNFKIRGNRERSIGLSYMLDEGDYANAGLSQNIKVSTDWQPMSVKFTPHGTKGKKARLSFNAMNEIGWLEIADVSVQVRPEGYLLNGMSLENSTVPFPTPDASSEVRRDAFRFLSHTENEWALRQKSFLKEELKVRQPISHSHVLFGGMLGARRESLVSDFIDNHGYWQHPEFPRRQWDMKDWLIKNTSQVSEATGGTLAEMAMQRPTGKPYCVSEYDIPAPSDAAIESLPMLAAFASQQDWDAIYTFTFTNDVKSFQGGKIHGFFDQSGHPAKHGMIPAAALMFRLGNIPKHTSTTTLEISADTLFDDCAKSNGDLWGAWRRIWKLKQLDGSISLGSIIQTTISESSRATEIKTSGTVASRAWMPEKSLFSLAEPTACALVGKISGAHDLNGTKVTIPALDGQGTASLAMVSVDGKPLSTSKRILVVALRAAENQQMKWNEARTSVSADWGQGPAMVLGLKAEIQLPGAAAQLIPLSQHGEAKSPVTATAGKLELSPTHQTMWYLITRP